jgi:hypothetical protein
MVSMESWNKRMKSNILKIEFNDYFISFNLYKILILFNKIIFISNKILYVFIIFIIYKFYFKKVYK